jgi:hypothetical protein
MVGCNGRFYYRQAFEDSKDSSSIFIAKTAFCANEPEKGVAGNDKNACLIPAACISGNTCNAA